MGLSATVLRNYQSYCDGVTVSAVIRIAVIGTGAGCSQLLESRRWCCTDSE